MARLNGRGRVWHAAAAAIGRTAGRIGQKSTRSALARRGLAERRALRPGARALALTQDRLTEKTFLRDLGLNRVRLISNNPEKMQTLAQMGFDLVERVALSIPTTDAAKGYLRTKKEKLGHYLELV